jgi:hypothetical protein
MGGMKWKAAEDNIVTIIEDHQTRGTRVSRFLHQICKTTCLLNSRIWILINLNVPISFQQIFSLLNMHITDQLT